MMLSVDFCRIEAAAIVGDGELREAVAAFHGDLHVLRLRVPLRVDLRLAHDVIRLRLRDARQRQRRCIDDLQLD
jgi:hypothetical protein